MARLTLYLFGGFQASVDDQPLSGIYDHVRALLAFLVSESDRPHRREVLAEMLWPEESEEVARRNLRQALSRLRAALGERDSCEQPFLLIDRSSIRFNRDSDHFFDVAAFAACSPADKQGKEAELSAADVPWLQEAVGLYRGHLLDQFHLPDNPSFEQWLAGRQEAYKRRALFYLRALTEYQESVGKAQQAIEMARRQIELEPWLETAHRQLMRLLARAGQRSAALAQYNVCRGLLQEELGVDPEPETEALRQAILEGNLEAAAAVAPSGGKSASGRRHVTVLYCGLAEPAGMDLEDFLDVVRGFKQRCAETAHRFEAHLEGGHGGAQILFFGFPNAHEDDAARAVHAALRILAEVEKLAAQHGVELALRAGIHTGLMVATDGETADLPVDLIGTPLNIAVQLRYQAEANGILISADTETLVRGNFITREREIFATPELTAGLPAHQVLRETQARARIDAGRGSKLTPFIGRDIELADLLEYWGQVRAGQGQLVLVEGEPGIGKSRLLHMFKRRLLQEPHSVRQLRCLPDYQTTALQPAVELLHQLCEFRASDPEPAREQKLAAALRALDLFSPEYYGLLAQLLGLPLPPKAGLLTVNPQQAKQRTLALIADMQRMTARQRPLLLVVEDLQWVDPSTLELLKLLAKNIGGSAIMLMLTLRAGVDHPWKRDAAARRVTVASLSAADVRRLALSVANNKALPESVLSQIVARTDGVPLFVEELTKTLLESKLLRETHSRYELIGSSPTVALPFTLHDSLMARLDRLGSAKHVAQLASVIGREFPDELLRAIADLDDDELQLELSRLVDAELLFQRQQDGEIYFGFRHAMIQEVAYESLLRRHRQLLHQKVAEALDALREQGTAIKPEILARHYQEACLFPEAVQHWYQAGLLASQQSAHHEALGHLQRGLQLVPELRDEDERERQELALRIALGVPLMMSSGPVPEIEQTYARALELVQRMPERRDLFAATRGLYTYYAGRADYHTAQRLAEQMLRTAEEQRRVDFMVEAHRALGTVYLLRGELLQAIRHLEFNIALYDPADHAELSLSFGMDPGLAAYSLLGIADWTIGYPERGRRRVLEAIGMAAERDHPATLGWTLNMGLTVTQLCGDSAAMLELADKLTAIAARHDIQLWSLWAEIIRKTARLMRDPDPELARRLSEEFAHYASLGWDMGRPYILALWAETCLQTGQVETGLRVVRDALAWVHQHDARLHEAELHRLEGELLLAGGEAPGTRVEGAFDRALLVARSQRALGTELRCVMSQARLLARQGRAAEGAHHLKAVLKNFDEGEATGDLKAAAELLAHLQQQRAPA